MQEFGFSVFSSRLSVWQKLSVARTENRRPRTENAYGHQSMTASMFEKSSVHTGASSGLGKGRHSGSARSGALVETTEGHEGHGGRKRSRT